MSPPADTQFDLAAHILCAHKKSVCFFVLYNETCLFALPRSETDKY